MGALEDCCKNCYLDKNSNINTSRLTTTSGCKSETFPTSESGTFSYAGRNTFTKATEIIKEKEETKKTDKIEVKKVSSDKNFYNSIKNNLKSNPKLCNTKKASIRTNSTKFVESNEKVSSDKSELGVRREKMKSVNRILILFVIDITSSMNSYIIATKKLVGEIIMRFKNSGRKITVGFVGYRDYCDLEMFVEINYSDFFNKEDFEQKFISSGGGDLPENLQGGLNKGYEMKFNNEDYLTKIVFLINDAPCHGTKYHDSIDDDYPDENGKLEDVVGKFARKGFDFSYIQVNANSTKKMSSIMEKTFNLNKGVNSFHSHIYDLTKDDIDKITSKFKDYFSSSINGSFNSFNNSLSLGKFVSSDHVLAKEWIKLNSVECIKQKFEICEYFYNDERPINLENLNSIYLKTLLKNIEFKPLFKSELLISKKEFSKGSEHIAYQAEYNNQNHIIKIPRQKNKHLKDLTDLKMSYLRIHLTKIILDEFNSKFNGKNSFAFKFSQTYALNLQEIEINDIMNDNRWVYIESYIEKFKKFNNNAGFFDPSHDDVNLTAQAFSHFSYEFSSGNLLICDLQGNKILTDIAIHSKIINLFGLLDWGEDGIKRFFSTHQCNKFCTLLNLEKMNYTKMETILEDEGDEGDDKSKN